jgi:cardiolipin synthase
MVGEANVEKFAAPDKTSCGNQVRGCCAPRGAAIVRPMDVITSRPGPARPLALPNLLTYARIAAVPAVVACMYWQAILQGGVWLRWVALAIFISAGITDFFDGYVARIWSQQSTFGRMLDPIADKLLVSSCLLMLAADGTIKGWSLWAAIVILCREILVSGLREYLAELRVSVPVTQLAKWKTTVQLVAIGFLLAGEAGDNKASAILGHETAVITEIGIGLLWISALVTLYTGWDYFRAGVRHLIDE